MEFFIALIISSGVSLAAAYMKTRNATHAIMYKNQTVAEKIIEDREFATWMKKDLETFKTQGTPSKSDVSDLLDKVEIFHTNAPLWRWSHEIIDKTLAVARTALEVTPSVDNRYLRLLTILVNETCESVLRLAGTEETAQQFIDTRNSIGGLRNTFKKYIGNI